MLVNDGSNEPLDVARDTAPDPTEEPTGPTAPLEAPEMRVQRTRTSSALVATVLGMLLAALMLVFVLQNGERQRYEFLWLDFSLPSGVAMLFGAIVGGLVVALIGLGRIVQIRLAARRHRRADRRSHV